MQRARIQYDSKTTRDHVSVLKHTGSNTNSNRNNLHLSREPNDLS